jgi:hypothetical protein
VVVEVGWKTMADGSALPSGLTLLRNTKQTQPKKETNIFLCVPLKSLKNDIFHYKFWLLFEP